MNAIELSNIEKSYNGRKVIKDLTLDFERGKRYLIFGESGLGKTTLFNIIKGYEEPDSGRVLTFDNNIEYLFQDQLLFSNLTIRENLKIKKNKCEKTSMDTEQALRILNIYDLIDNKVNTLSGGERQRVELAGILLGEPDVILLDEPTSKLDEKNKRNLINTLNDVFRDKTLIVSSHERLFTEFDFEMVSFKEGMVRYEE